MIIRELKPDRTHIEPTPADARDTPQTCPGGGTAHGREPASIDPFRRTGVYSGHYLSRSFHTISRCRWGAVLGPHE